MTRLVLKDRSGSRHALFVEVAADPTDRVTGLSNRTELAEDAGMLFVIPVKNVGFWMKDTYIPLSVAFLGPCGEIVHIADMEPLSLELHDTDRPYSFGLEVNRGWFEKHDVEVGSSVELPPELLPASCR